VHVELRLPGLLGDLQERLGLGRAGVVDQDVDLAQRPDRAGDEGLDLIVIADIGLRPPTLAAERGDLVRGAFGPGAVPVHHGDVRAGPRQSQRDRLADAPPAPVTSAD